MASLNCLIHPHHVSMGKHHTSIQTLYQHIEDPYYGLDKHPSHAGVSVPRFDVREDDNAFYLDGDVPGALGKEIFTETIDNITLIIRGSVKPKAGSENAKAPQTNVNGDSSKAAPKESGKEMIWKLKERHVGPFERSFTFPSHFKQGSMDMHLEAGVLSIKLLKDPEADKEAEVHRMIESEI